MKEYPIAQEIYSLKHEANSFVGYIWYVTQNSLSFTSTILMSKL